MIKKNEIATAKTYVQKVLEQSAYQPNQTDEEKRQILCAFCFGVLNGFLMERKIEMPQFHALMLHTLNDQMG